MEKNLPTAVIDTSVLIGLHHLNLLWELTNLFHRIHVPVSVRNEFIERNERTNLRDAISELISGKFFLPCDDYDSAEVEILRLAGLHYGESEVISQAKQLEATVILMDEKKGRKIAMREGRSVKGTIGLLAIFETLKIIVLKDAVEKLISEKKFRITEKIIEEARRDARRYFDNES
ncbi:MAG: hypothetical protein HY960_07710 [Ignavibacteriae bacterium]|nr:hypothetical protein [Ignavibacteriota bacterium]